MQVLYDNGSGVKKLEVEEFYRDVAKELSQEDVTTPFIVHVECDAGEVDYKLSLRSGTLFIVELNNTLPSSFANVECKSRFLTFVNKEKNSYKFYRLDPIGDDRVKASYGRMGVQKGQLFGERFFFYPRSMYWVKYMEKVAKGYVDRSDIYISEDTMVEDLDHSSPRMESANTPSSRLFCKLYQFANDIVKKARVQVPINDKIVAESKKLLDQMRESEDVDSFNKVLLELVSILQRPVETGNGMGVKNLLAKKRSDFSSIINREEDLIMSMEGVLNGNKRSVSADFSAYGIQVYEATEKQRAQVMEHLAPSLKEKVKQIYRVIPEGQQQKFNEYIRKNRIKTVKQLWHGSGNGNWLSIIKTSLSLNPKAKIHGKMFGNGIYFAPSSMKSFGYTSFLSSFWEQGTSDTAFMGLYATAYGNPYKTDGWSGAADYKQIVKGSHGAYNCLHAVKGSALKNDEIIFYDEDAIVLNYIVEFGK